MRTFNELLGLCLFGFVFFQSSSALAVPAKNRMIVFGGNCEEQNGEPEYSNAFRDTFIKLSGGYREHGWDVRPLFDGQLARCSVRHSECQEKHASPSQCCPPSIDLDQWSNEEITKAANYHADEATKENLIISLKEAASQMQHGSQLLLSIATHGSRGSGEQAHSICLSDGTLMPINDPDFLKALDALKANGVKLGFVDGSCFGGGSVPVLGKYGCVISGQSSNRPATTVFDINLAMVPGKTKDVGLLENRFFNMEDVFLHNLLSGFDQPQISGFTDENDLSERLHALAVKEGCDLFLSSFDKLDRLTKDVLAISKKALQQENFEKLLASRGARLAVPPAQLETRIKEENSEIRKVTEQYFKDYDDYYKWVRETPKPWLRKTTLTPEEREMKSKFETQVGARRAVLKNKQQDLNNTLHGKIENLISQLRYYRYQSVKDHLEHLTEPLSESDREKRNQLRACADFKLYKPGN